MGLIEDLLTPSLGYNPPTGQPEDSPTAAFGREVATQRKTYVDPRTGDFPTTPERAQQYAPVQNLGQLATVLKLLSGAPEDLKTTLLSRMTGIPLTSAKSQALQNAITLAQERAEEQRPMKEEILNIRKEQARQTIEARRESLDMRHQMLIGNILGGMSRIAEHMGNMMPHSPEYQQLHDIYVEMAKRHKALTGIDLSPKTKAEPSGSRTGASKPAGADKNEMMRQLLESMGAKQVLEPGEGGEGVSY